jgi:bifunctional DNA-binding transcriptional regulator/antitoxin component of YhaV-PrlF toxin-antitoxin module
MGRRSPSRHPRIEGLHFSRKRAILPAIPSCVHPREIVSKIKVRAGGQVKIPAKIAVKYKLHEGDVLHVHDAGGAIMFIPEKVRRNKKLRQELNEKLWDQMEQEAEDAIARGELSGPFDNVEKLIAHLRRQKS